MGGRGDSTVGKEKSFRIIGYSNVESLILSHDFATFVNILRTKTFWCGFVEEWKIVCLAPW